MTRDDGLNFGERRYHVLGRVDRFKRILGRVSSPKSLAAESPERLRFDIGSGRWFWKKIVQLNGAAEWPLDRNTGYLPQHGR
jgi:hypothetical protein